MVSESSLIFPSLRRDEHQGYQFPSTLLYTRREHPHRVGRNLSFAFEVCGKAAVINLHRSACCELTPRRYQNLRLPLALQMAPTAICVWTVLKEQLKFAHSMII
jgi:hypothetical protein